ncbi:MAG: OprO/OprP family phosphate-selective porin [Planctomycetota bacterium]
MSLEERVAKLEAAAGKNSLDVYWDNGIKLKSRDGGNAFSGGLTGRLQWDAMFAHYNDDLKTVLGANATETDQTEFRRARLAMYGEVYKKLFFKLEVDFAGGAVNFRTAAMGIDHIPFVGKLLFGSTFEPFQLEESTSDLNLTFLDRSTINVFAEDYATGVQISNQYKPDGGDHDVVQWAVGVFRASGKGGNPSGNDTGQNKAGKYNLTGRVSGVPYYDAKGAQMAEIGFSFSLRNPNTFAGGFQQVSYNLKPDAHMSPTWATATIDASKVTMFGFDAAVVFQSFWASGEFTNVSTTAPSGSGAKGATFNGYYIDAGYFLTGEHRPYDYANGVFGGVKPIHNAFEDDGNGGVGYGAFELAARYGMLNLEDTSAGVYGGKASIFTVGANWYLSPTFRYMLDFIDASLDQKLAGGGKNKGNANILEMRFQTQW